MITPVAAARLILADYDGVLDSASRLDIDGCQSVIVDHAGETVLVIRGSDERQDWINNFRFLPDATPGDSVWWHRGFLTYARVAYSWARDKPVTVVIGHSLGAACVQIVATSLGIPGLAFASPRPLWAPFGKARPSNEAMVTNYNRIDDVICDLPFAVLGFEHVGEVKWLTPKELHAGEEHRIKHYLDLLDVAESQVTPAEPPSLENRR